MPHGEVGAFMVCECANVDAPPTGNTCNAKAASDCRASSDTQPCNSQQQNAGQDNRVTGAVVVRMYAGLTAVLVQDHVVQRRCTTTVAVVYHLLRYSFAPTARFRLRPSRPHTNVWSARCFATPLSTSRGRDGKHLSPQKQHVSVCCGRCRPKVGCFRVDDTVVQDGRQTADSRQNGLRDR